MVALAWDQVGGRLYETGVDKGVLYIPNASGVYDTGYAWNGLVSVTESPSGAEPNPQYADNIKYLNLLSAESFEGTIEAFTYPDQFAQCDGTAFAKAGLAVGQQSRKSFGLAYRTKLGNDVDGIDYGYKLHLVYGLLASPAEKAYETVNDSPEALTFSWDFTSTPAPVTGFKPTSVLTVNSKGAGLLPADLTTLETALYGGAATTAHLPTPTEVIAMFTTAYTP